MFSGQDSCGGENRMGNIMPPQSEVAGDETRNMISAHKVIGTKVYNRREEHLGSVYGLMLNKLNGQVAYAIMSFGGFLGLGESYHPLPWRMMTYDTRLEAYVVDLDRSRLEQAPRCTTEPDWDTYRKQVDAYYLMPLV